MFKTIKGKLIFVVIFSVICIIITSILVMYKRIDIKYDNSEETFKTEETKANESTNEKGIDLKGKYNQNDLKIVEKRVTKERVEITYFQIDGLKDQKIQDKINKEIEIEALNGYKENIDLDKVVNASISLYETANFSNILSFSSFSWGKINDDSDDLINVQKGFTYDLNTGNLIKLEDLFTTNAPITEILRKSAYYGFVSNRAEMNLSGDLQVNNYGNIEEDVADFIEQYKNGKITDFYCTPSAIMIVYDEIYIPVSFEEWADYINIYNKYLSSESLYKSNNIGYKNLYTLTDRTLNDFYYYTNYQNEKNYFIEISVLWDEDNSSDFEKQLVSNKIKDIEREVSDLKVKANQDTNNFYILNYYIEINGFFEQSLDENLVSVTEWGNYYDMTIHDFETKIEPIIIKYDRSANEGGGIPEYVYNFTDVLKIEPQRLTEYYNIETGEKVVV